MIAMAVASLAMLLRALKLPTVARHADEVAQLAEREGWTFVRYLHHLVELEIHERRRRRIARNLKDSELPPDKLLATLERARLPMKVAKMLPATEHDVLEHSGSFGGQLKSKIDAWPPRSSVTNQP